MKTPSYFEHTWTSDQTEQNDPNIVVLKIGSSSISGEDGNIRLSTLSSFVETVKLLMDKGYKIVIVSSGAVSVGCNRLQLKERPTNIIEKQACAAAGQSRLIRLYEDLFSIFNIPVAQILLTRDNISHEYHYLNANNTIRQLLKMNIVPIINENDALSAAESKLGDNDTLSALVSAMIKAKYLILLTDVDALYTDNPKTNPHAKPIRVVDNVAAFLESSDRPVIDGQQSGTPSPVTSPGGTTTIEAEKSGPTPIKSGQWGTGGMTTKIQAALLASYSGVSTGIISSEHFDHIERILIGDNNVGTLFKPAKNLLTGRKKWLSHGIPPSGVIYIEPLAGVSLTASKTTYNIYPSSIVAVEGVFPSNACVTIRIWDPENVSKQPRNTNLVRQASTHDFELSERFARQEGYYEPSVYDEEEELNISESDSGDEGSDDSREIIGDSQYNKYIAPQSSASFKGSYRYTSSTSSHSGLIPSSGAPVVNASLARSSLTSSSQRCGSSTSLSSLGDNNEQQQQQATTERHSSTEVTAATSDHHHNPEQDVETMSTTLSVTPSIAVTTNVPVYTDIGRGLVNYSSYELLEIKGKHSKDLYNILNYHGPSAAINRENLAIWYKDHSCIENK